MEGGRTASEKALCGGPGGTEKPRREGEREVGGIQIEGREKRI